MRVVLIGDSIRMGYQPGVAERLKGWADVWGPEQNCRHSLWALDHFQEWVVAHKPDILHVNFGIHDAVVMEDGEYQVIPDQYRLCLKRFITKAEDLGTRMIWATSTPRFTPSQDVPMSEWQKMTEIDDYNRTALEIIGAVGIPVNDLHQVILDSDFTKCQTADGCHMTDYGNAVLADAVARFLMESEDAA